MKGFPQVGFLKPLVKNPNIVVGDYSYYDDPEGPEQFESKCVLYHFPFVGDRLVIGKFCALARGVRFIMNGANHQISGFSTYPFYIFGNGWESVTPQPGDFPSTGLFHSGLRPGHRRAGHAVAGPVAVRGVAGLGQIVARIFGDGRAF